MQVVYPVLQSALTYESELNKDCSGIVCRLKPTDMSLVPVKVKTNIYGYHP